MTPRKKVKDPGLVWEAPPDGPIRGNKYSPAMAALKKSPGRWARIRVSISQAGAYGTRKALRRIANGDERYEFVTRPVEEGDGYGVWARYRTDAQMQEP